jgi:amidase
MNRCIPIAATCFATLSTPTLASDFKVEEATIPAIERAFREHRLTCHDLVKTYLDRIATYDKQGPKLNAMRLAEANLHDATFAEKGAVGPLHCGTVILKDNYNTGDLPTRAAPSRSKARSRARMHSS